MTSLRKMYDREMLIRNKNLQNLRETDAGQKALELDKADGNQDGKISANIWNNYIEKNYDGIGTKISENGSINIIDAMNSITTYTIREETEAHNADVAKIKEEALPRLEALRNEEVGIVGGGEGQEQEPQEPQFGL